MPEDVGRQQDVAARTSLGKSSVARKPHEPIQAGGAIAKTRKFKIENR
jgi:hypothetical protein